MKAIITIELDYPEQIYDLYETKELRLYDDKGEFFIWEGGFEIKPIPQYKDTDMYSDKYGFGWNDCIKKILGEQQ